MLRKTFVQQMPTVAALWLTIAKGPKKHVAAKKAVGGALSLSRVNRLSDKGSTNKLGEYLFPQPTNKYSK